jgi:anti-sigma factor RsiW
MKSLDELKDGAMAGRLSPEEEREWTRLVAEEPELEAEVALGRALQALPEPPLVSTNFTTRVLEEVRRGERRSMAQGTDWMGWLRSLRFARVASAAVVVGGLCFATLQQRRNSERDVADAVRTFAGGVSAVAPAPEAEAMVSVFQDFDAIRRLPGSGSDVDYGLLAALRSE